MANGDEYEKFEITDHDLQNEFNTGFRRKGLSKEQQIYGIWAENEDDEVRLYAFVILLELL